MDDFTRPSVRYLTLSVFWVSLLGIPKSLVIWVQGYPKHGDTQITVTAVVLLSSMRITYQSTVCAVARNLHLNTSRVLLRARSIQPVFPGRGSKISSCRMDRDQSERSRSIPLTTWSFALILIGGCWITVARTISTVIWHCESCFMRNNLTSVTGYFEQTVPRCLLYEFKHYFRMKKRTFQILSVK